MILDTWAEVLTRSFQDLWIDVVNFIPNLLVAILIFILGWVVGALVGRIIAQAVRSIRVVDNGLRSAGFEGVLQRAGYTLDAGAFLGALVKWFIIIVFLVAALDVLRLAEVNLFLQRVLLYLPNVIVAVLILLVASVIAEVVNNIVSGAARAAEMGSPVFLGSVARWAIWIFAALAALDQLNVAPDLVRTLFTGIVVSISLALGLSFGLGGQNAAAQYIERMKNEFSRRSS